MMMKTNGPSAAAAAAVVAGVLAHAPRRATPETLSLDSVTTQPTNAAETARNNTSAADLQPSQHSVSPSIRERAIF